MSSRLCRYRSQAFIGVCSPHLIHVMLYEPLYTSYLVKLVMPKRGRGRELVRGVRGRRPTVLCPEVRQHIRDIRNRPGIRLLSWREFADMLRSFASERPDLWQVPPERLTLAVVRRICSGDLGLERPAVSQADVNAFDPAVVSIIRQKVRSFAVGTCAVSCRAISRWLFAVHGYNVSGPTVWRILSVYAPRRRCVPVYALDACHLALVLRQSCDIVAGLLDKTIMTDEINLSCEVKSAHRRAHKRVWVDRDDVPANVSVVEVREAWPYMTG
jgi:hypothetical protein